MLCYFYLYICYLAVQLDCTTDSTLVVFFSLRCYRNCPNHLHLQSLCFFSTPFPFLFFPNLSILTRSPYYTHYSCSTSLSLSSFPSPHLPPCLSQRILAFSSFRIFLLCSLLSLYLSIRAKFTIELKLWIWIVNKPPFCLTLGQPLSTKMTYIF